MMWNLREERRLCVFMEQNHEEQQENQVTSPRDNWLKTEVVEWGKALLIAVVLVTLMRWLLFTPTIVSGPSMEPNFWDQQRLIVNKMIYRFKEPDRGEVVVFHAPEQKDYIKRVIALPGESVRIEKDHVYINGELLNEPYIAEAIAEAARNNTTYNTRDFKMTGSGIREVTVPDGHLFLVGDNRPNSKDSRMESVGFIPISEVVGRADIIFWPLGDFQWIKHPDYEVK